MSSKTPAIRVLTLSAVTLATSTALLTFEASAKGGHGMGGGFRSMQVGAMQVRPVVRDHRMPMSARPKMLIMRDHRAPKPVISRPLVRDHRGVVATANAGLDGKRPLVRDHRDGTAGGGVTPPSGGIVTTPPGAGTQPPIAPPTPPPPGPRPPSVVPPVVVNPPVVSPPGSGVRPPSVPPVVVNPPSVDPRPPGPVVVDPCTGSGCTPPHHPPHRPPHHGGVNVVLAAVPVIDDGCFYEWRRKRIETGAVKLFKVKVCPLPDELP